MPINVINLADIYGKAQKERANEQLMQLQDLKMQEAMQGMQQKRTLRDLVASSYTPPSAAVPFETDEEAFMGQPPLTGLTAKPAVRGGMNYDRLAQGLAGMGDFESMMKVQDAQTESGSKVSKAHQEKIKAAQQFVDAGDAMGLEQFVRTDDETPDDVKVAVNKDGSMSLMSSAWPQPRTIKPSLNAQKMGGGSDQYSSPLYSKDGAFSYDHRTGRVSPIMHNGKQIIGATSDPTLRHEIKRAEASGAASGKSEAEAQIELPKNIQEAANTIKLVDDLLAHPGMKTAVGTSSLLGIQKVPGTEAKAFMTRLDQLRGKQFLQAYETLKGGGQITEVEGQKATQAMARMDNASTEQEFITASREFQDIIRQGVQRAREKAGVAAPQMQGIAEGTTRTNRRTGEVQVFQGGQWQRQ